MEQHLKQNKWNSMRIDISVLITGKHMMYFDPIHMHFYVISYAFICVTLIFIVYFRCVLIGYSDEQERRKRDWKKDKNATKMEIQQDEGRQPPWRPSTFEYMEKWGLTTVSQSKAQFLAPLKRIESPALHDFLNYFSPLFSSCLHKF